MLAVLKTYFASKKKEVRTALRLKRLKNIRSKTDGSLYKVKVLPTIEKVSLI